MSVQRKPSRSDDVGIVGAYVAGQTIARVASRFGRSRSYVMDRLRRFGIPRGRGLFPLAEEVQEEIVRRYENLELPSRIGEGLGEHVTEGVVLCVLRNRRGEGAASGRGDSLVRLARIVEARAREGDPTASYTAKLLAAGVSECAKKLGEEAVEAALAATGGSSDEVVAECADVLYHTLVVLAARNVAVEAVYRALDERAGFGGLEEKAMRRKGGA